MFVVSIKLVCSSTQPFCQKPHEINQKMITHEVQTTQTLLRDITEEILPRNIRRVSNRRKKWSIQLMTHLLIYISELPRYLPLKQM